MKKYLMGLLSIFLIISICGLVSAGDFTVGLYNAYQFNETPATDNLVDYVSGNDSTSDSVSGGTGAGIHGLGWDCDSGTSDNVVMKKLLDELTAFSLSIWLYPQSDGDGAWPRVIGMTSGSGESDLSFDDNNGDNWEGRLTTSGNSENIAASSKIKADNKWVHIVWTYNGTHNALWVNGTFSTAIAQTGKVIANVVDTRLCSHPNGGSNYFDGILDEMYIWHNITGLDGGVLTADNISTLYDGGTGLFYNQTDFGGGASPPPDPNTYFKIEAQDVTNGTTIYNFTATIVNSSFSESFTTHNGTVLFTNRTGLYNITVTTSPYQQEYHIYRRSDYNGSVDLNVYMQPYNRLFNYSFSEFYYNGSINFVRDLNVSFNATCIDNSTSNILIYINGTINDTVPLTCNNATSFYYYNYTHTIEGYYNISFALNSSYRTALYNPSINYSYLSDLYNPAVLDFNYTYPLNGFGAANTNITLRCYDNITGVMQYNLTFNGVNFYNDNASNGTLILNQTFLVNGYNNLSGVCGDYFGETVESISNLFYVKTLYLINEKNGSFFDVTNLTSARVYFDDNHTFFNFKTDNVSAVNFTTYGSNKLRFELGYEGGTIITRYLDVTLLGDDIRVCANVQGTTHYEQLIISSLQKPVVVNNVFAQCTVAADYTRFAYQDSYLLKGFTIDSLYYLYTFEGTSQSFLASVDGSVQTYINIDTLEFNQEGYTLNILGSFLTFEPEDEGQVRIFYRNLDDSNTGLTLTITRMDTDTIIMQTSTFTDYNNFTLLFDYSTLTNVTNSTIFKVELNRTMTGGSTESIKRYFNAQGKKGLLRAEVGIVIAILLLVFGLTFTVASLSLGWFGIGAACVSFAVLGLSIATWYITFMMAINAIVLIYLILLMIQEYYPTIA
jgi:hypothetical protein